MQVSRPGCREAVALLRSVVKVAMPQRRGREFPTKAMRWNSVMSVPPGLWDADLETSSDAGMALQRQFGPEIDAVIGSENTYSLPAMGRLRASETARRPLRQCGADFRRS